ncbi:MAG: DUF2332 domain-containing protein [Actinomycetota bacterium]
MPCDVSRAVYPTRVVRVTASSSARLRVSRQLAWQAEQCRDLGSPLYARLLSRAAADAEAGGIVWQVLRRRQRDPFSSALGLRFMGAVHRIVLDGRGDRLAVHYPSVGGDPRTKRLWTDFSATLAEHEGELRDAIGDPVQTNEVARAAALVGGFLRIAQQRKHPLRLLELGASAGLNLRWDHFRYVAGRRRAWGPPRSPVRLEAAFRGEVPLRGVCEITERGGCDTTPIDPATREGELRLKSFVWADQVERSERLAAAIAIARRVPVTVDLADAADWLEAQLDRLRRDVTTVVFHTIVWQYLGRRSQERVTTAIEAAGRRARSDRPLAWLRLEPGGDMAKLTLTMWPGGDECLLARSGYHGDPVIWLA